jgi:hypothetical protein
MDFSAGIFSAYKLYARYRMCVLTLFLLRFMRSVRLSGVGGILAGVAFWDFALAEDTDFVELFTPI